MKLVKATFLKVEEPIDDDRQNPTQPSGAKDFSRRRQLTRSMKNFAIAAAGHHEKDIVDN